MQGRYAMVERAGANDGTRGRFQIVSGLIVRLRGWFGASRRCNGAVSAAPSIAPMTTPSIERIGPPSQSSFERPSLPVSSLVSRSRASAAEETVIRLPTSRRQLLNQLARDMRMRLEDVAASGADPLLLVVASGPHQRLQIDSSSYIEVLEEPAPYRVVLGDEFGTRIMLETGDFDLAHHFILQYLLLTRDDVSPVEGAS